MHDSIVPPIFRRIPTKRMFVSKRCETHRMMSFGIMFMANMISDRERLYFQESDRQIHTISEEEGNQLDGVMKQAKNQLGKGFGFPSPAQIFHRSPETGQAK